MPVLVEAVPAVLVAHSTCEEDTGNPALSARHESVVGVLLQHSQRAGARDGFGAPLHAELLEDLAIVPLDRVQREE